MTENSPKPILVELSAELKDEFLEMAADHRAHGEDRYEHALEDFDDYLAELERYRTGRDLPPSHVSSSAYFLLVAGKLVGSGNLRHELNENLSVMGGHIGYAVRPSARRKGYGSLILALTLEKARARGLEKVFLTCDADNAASAKIIEKHGGRLVDQLIYEPTGKLISQYWIEL